MATKVVYEREGDLWLYTVTGDALQRLTTTPEREYAPKFIDADRISFLRIDAPGTSIFELRVSNGARRLLFRTPAGRVAGYAWSPGRTTIAYWLGNSEASSHELRLYSPGNNSDRLVRRFGAFEGREGVEDDEIEVGWAPDGRAVLLVATPLENSPSMFLTRGTGENVIPPRDGTFARIAPDGTKVIYREFGGQRRWFSVTIPSNSASALNASNATYRAALSPDGSSLAFDDAKNRPSVFVYAFGANTERRVGEGIRPIWLGPDSVAVSNTTACVETGGEPCFTAYKVTGTVDRISITDGSRKRLRLATTEGDVLYA